MSVVESQGFLMLLYRCWILETALSLVNVLIIILYN